MTRAAGPGEPIELTATLEVPEAWSAGTASAEIAPGATATIEIPVTPPAGPPPAGLVQTITARVTAGEMPAGRRARSPRGSRRCSAATTPSPPRASRSRPTARSWSPPARESAPASNWWERFTLGGGREVDLRVSNTEGAFWKVLAVFVHS